MSNGYRDLKVWQKSIDLVEMIYKFSQSFPEDEKYGLTSQMRRCAVSIPSNIAEGSKRTTKKDFRHFITIALGSAAELETQIEISKRMSFGDTQKREDISTLLTECMKIMSGMIRSFHT